MSGHTPLEWDALQREQNRLRAEEARLTEERAAIIRDRDALRKEQQAWAEKIDELSRLEDITVQFRERLEMEGSPYADLVLAVRMDPTIFLHAKPWEVQDLYLLTLQERFSKLAQYLGTRVNEQLEKREVDYRVRVPNEVGYFDHVKLEPLPWEEKPSDSV